MTSPVSQSECNDERIEAFLLRRLTVEQERSFEEHLEQCSCCQEQLSNRVATQEDWSEAQTLLGDVRWRNDPYSGFSVALPSFDDSSNSADDAKHRERTIESRHVRSVLDSLSPTDDPQMLGRIAGYEVLAVVGCGGMGAVLKAVDPALNRVVAIKVMAPHLANSGAARQRFSREAQAAAAITHDNVVEIYGVAEADGLPYLVMQYSRGSSLEKRIADNGPLAVADILRIGVQVASGLSAAHSQGLIHRDIKPSNILLGDGNQRLMITDFGLARAVDDASVTKTGIIAGTPQFMSPEQARGDSLDFRSDLFSLGSVLYTACTARAPFRGDSPYGILRRITDSHPRPIREFNPEIPDWFCAIIDKLLAKQASNRFGSASEVSELLEDCLAHTQQPTSVPLPNRVKQLTSPQPTGRRRVGALSVSCIAVAVVLAGITIDIKDWKGTILIKGDPDHASITIRRGEEGTKVAPDEASKSLSDEEVPLLGEPPLLGELPSLEHDASNAVDLQSLDRVADKVEAISRQAKQLSDDVDAFLGDALALKAKRSHPAAKPSLSAQATDSNSHAVIPRINDRVHLTLKGDIATEYLRQLDELKRQGESADYAPQYSSSTLEVSCELIARVTQELKDDRYRLEHFSKPKLHSKKRVQSELDSVVVLEAIVDRSELKVDSGSAIVQHASPQTEKSRFDSALEQTQTFRVTLSTLENYSIRQTRVGSVRADPVESGTDVVSENSVTTDSTEIKLHKVSRSTHFQVAEGHGLTTLTERERTRILGSAESIWERLRARWDANESDVAGQTIQLKVVANDLPAAGSSQWSRDLSNPEIHVSGSLDDIIANVLPRQMTHIFLARLAGKSLPRWVSMGTGLLAESAEKRSSYWAKLRDLRDAGLLLPLAELLSAKQVPVNDAHRQRLHIQSMAFCQFLLSQYGRETFLGLAKEPIAPSSIDATEKNFGLWLDSFRKNENLPIGYWQLAPIENSANRRAGENSAISVIRFTDYDKLDCWLTPRSLPLRFGYKHEPDEKSKWSIHPVGSKITEGPHPHGCIVKGQDSLSLHFESGKVLKFVRIKDPLAYWLEQYKAIRLKSNVGNALIAIKGELDQQGYRDLGCALTKLAWGVPAGVRIDHSHIAQDYDSSGFIDIAVAEANGEPNEIVQRLLRRLYTESGERRAESKRRQNQELEKRVDELLRRSRPDSVLRDGDKPADSAKHSPVVEDSGLRLVGFWEVIREISAPSSEDGRTRRLVEKGIAEFKQPGSRFYASIRFDGESSTHGFQYVLLPHGDHHLLELAGGDLGDSAICKLADDSASATLDFNHISMNYPPVPIGSEEADTWQLKRITEQEYERRLDQYRKENEAPGEDWHIR